MTLLRTGLDIVRQMVAFARARGVPSVARSTVRRRRQWLLGSVGIRTTPRTFELDGRAVPYSRHRYNHTWLNERAVEVALAREVLQGSEQLAVLEVGERDPVRGRGSC